MSKSRLHFEVEDSDGEPKRDIEVMAYVVIRYFGLDTSNSAFYRAARRGDDSGIIQERLGRISAVVGEFIEKVGRSLQILPNV